MLAIEGTKGSFLRCDGSTGTPLTEFHLPTTMEHPFRLIPDSINQVPVIQTPGASIVSGSKHCLEDQPELNSWVEKRCSSVGHASDQLIVDTSGSHGTDSNVSSTATSWVKVDACDAIV